MQICNTKIPCTKCYSNNYSQLHHSQLLSSLQLRMIVFFFTDIHTISVIKTTENYVNISTGFQFSFTEINALLQSPQITVAGKMYQLNFYFCCDYKVYIASQLASQLQLATAQLELLYSCSLYTRKVCENKICS